MTADTDIDLERNPFTQPLDDELTDEPAPRIVDAAERLKQAAGDNVRRLRAAAEAGMRNYRDSTDEETTSAEKSQNLEEIQAKLKQWHRDGETWARENPTAAVAVAAGVGFVLGMILRR